MKKLIGLLAFIVLSQSAFALDMVYTDLVGRKGRLVNSTIILSSVTATVISPESDYCEVLFSTANATWYYRADGTTTSVTTSGMSVGANEKVAVSAVNGNAIAVQFIAGSSSQTVRTLRFEIR